MVDNSPASQQRPEKNFIFDHVTNWEDRILPSQPLLAIHFQHPQEEYYPRLMNKISQLSAKADPEDRFDLELPPDIAFSQIGSSMFVLKTLEMLIKIGGYKRVLEIGTFIGVSAMCFADAVGPGGRVVTVEKYPQLSEMAKRNIQRNGYADRVDVLQGNALEMIDDIGAMEKFDLIFLDGDKENYDEYYTKLHGLIKPGGIFIVDDIFFHADILNDTPSTKKGAGVAMLLDRLARDESIEKAVLPAVNGMLLVRRRE